MVAMVKIFLDPGHGGTDPGATGNGLQEKNVNLDIALRVRDFLSQYDVDVKMSRIKDDTVTLRQRSSTANDWGADFYVSIHCNAFNGQVSGYEDFIYSGRTVKETPKYQDIMHKAIRDNTDFFNNRGKKKANFHVLRETKMPSFLSENGFIDNKKDAKLLKDKDRLDDIAYGHALGIVNSFNLKPKTADSGKLYKVQVGAFKNKNNADKLAKELQGKGYETYIIHE